MKKDQHTEYAKSYKTNFAEVRSISAAIIDLLEKKNKEYGESFRLRGGQGAFFAYVRKPDRLQAQLARRGYDIFDVSTDGSTEEIDETIKDEIGYLLLIMETREAIRKHLNSEAQHPQSAGLRASP